MPKLNHGGKRAGAGRPPRKQPREALTIRVEPETANDFRAECEKYARSQSEQFAEYVRQSITKPKTK